MRGEDPLSVARVKLVQALVPGDRPVAVGAQRDWNPGFTMGMAYTLIDAGTPWLLVIMMLPGR